MTRNSIRPVFMLSALAIAIMLCTPALHAQGAMGAQGGAGSQPDKAEMAAKMEKMSAALQLTPPQKEQMRPIIMQEAMALKNLKANASLSPMQKAMQARQIADAADAKVKPILNPQQYQTYEQIRAQERQEMMQKMQNR